MDPLPQSEASPLGSVGATRKLMEHTARNIVLTRPNMSLQCGSLVTGLRFSDDNSTVAGTAAPCSTNVFHGYSRANIEYVTLAVWKPHSRGSCSVNADLGAGVLLKDGNEISADIVVDASGRNSKVSEWLEAAGCSAPPQQVINSGLGYGTRTYKMPKDWRVKHVCSFLPHLTRGPKSRDVSCEECCFA